MSNLNKLSGAIRFALFAGAATMLSAPAFAQGQAEGEEAATLDRIEVTGSRIKRVAVEGALPITVIDRQSIEMSGEANVADLLRNTTFNSFGSFRPQSGSSAQSFAGISLRGLGEGRTLILVDGRRAPIAPQLGQAQDLNAIPMAAVERIEILSDGASAIYGSDAIAGVINIITRKDFNGVEMTYGESNPKLEGGATSEASVIFGTSSDRGRLMGGVSTNSRDIVFQRDRPWSSGGVSTFGNNFLTAIAAPGTLYGFRPGGFLANPTYGAAVPNGCNDPGFFPGGSGSTGRCFYDFTFVAADEAAIDNQSLFLRADYQINDDWSTYLNGNVTRVESFGRYAPVPSSPWPGGAIFIPAGSPNHPAVRFPGAYASMINTPVFLRHRFAALGNRDTFIDANTYDINVGFMGRIGEIDLDFGARSTESKYLELGKNYVVGGLAQAAISSGAYNIYNPSGNNRTLLNSMIATINRDAVTKMKEYYALASFDLFDMAGGTAGMAVGAEYRTENYADIYDTLQSSGQIVGSAGNSAWGSRTVKAAYFEALFPIIDTLEATLAGRFDKYSDYGNDFAPKAALRWQPMDDLVLRASYGQGFRAPTLDVVSAQPAFGATSINDPQTCVAYGQAPTCNTQVTTYTIANPNLFSEQSDQYSLGVAWDAAEWINLSLDYYSTSIEDRTAFISLSTIRNCLAGANALCPPGLSNLPTNVNPPQAHLGLGIARDPITGEILYGQLGYANLGTIDTDGFDLNVRTNFDFGGFGGLKNTLQVSYVNDYSIDGGDSITDRPSVPTMRAVLSNVWAKGDFSVAWNISHIDSTLSTQGAYIQDCDGVQACINSIDYGYAHRLPSWTTHDVQATWSAPWNGRLTIGVNNLTDKPPVLDPFDPTGRGYDFELYDGYGRVPYFRYTQTF